MNISIGLAENCDGEPHGIFQNRLVDVYQCPSCGGFNIRINFPLDLVKDVHAYVQMDRQHLDVQAKFSLLAPNDDTLTPEQLATLRFSRIDQ